jgi:hypothetical protein
MIAARRTLATRVCPLAEDALRSFCRLQDRFNKFLSMSGAVGSLVGDRRMTDPDRLTSHVDQTTFGRDTGGVILRIFVVACLGVLFWQAIIATGML